MFGLMVIGVAFIYFILWMGAVVGAHAWAKRRGYSKSKTLGLAFAAFLVMYLIPFWDHLPTLVAHKYYCEKEAGFFVYKTLDEWKKENLGVTEMLTPYMKPFEKKYMPLQYVPREEPYPGAGYKISKLNERIYYDSKLEKGITKTFPVHKWSLLLADSKTGAKLAEFVYFTSGYGNPMTTGGLPGFKVWLARDGCSGEQLKKAKLEFNRLFNDVIHMGDQQ